eukprot:3429761-Rhodomonas_salina.1
MPGRVDVGGGLECVGKRPSRRVQGETFRRKEHQRTKGTRADGLRRSQRVRREDCNLCVVPKGWQRCASAA